MKTKVLIVVGLIFQVCFLLFVLVQAPEPHGAVQIGLERLKENSPAQAVTINKTTDKVWTINTAGDFFFMADNGFQFIIKAVVCFILINIVFSVFLLFAIRKSAPLPTTIQS